MLYAINRNYKVAKYCLVFSRSYRMIDNHDHDEVFHSGPGQIISQDLFADLCLFMFFLIVCFLCW